MTRLFKCNICGIVMDEVYVYSEFNVILRTLGNPNRYDFCAKCNKKIEDYIGLIKNE